MFRYCKYSLTHIFVFQHFVRVNRYEILKQGNIRNLIGQIVYNSPLINSKQLIISMIRNAVFVS